MYQIPDNRSTIRHWYAVQCKPHGEWHAAATLQSNLDLKVYLPVVQRYFRGQVQSAPFFPGYLFVQADLHEITVSRINAMPGVVRLVAFGDIPQPVPLHVLEAIHAGVESINTHGGLPHFHPGETVRLKDGPLRGLEAVFVGPLKPSERVRVLLEFLGRLSEVEVDANSLESTNSGSPPRQERRTRGRGRRIKHSQ